MYDFTFFENAIDTLKEFKRYDLLTYYRNTEGIKQGTSAGYYWANDGHHNATGYALMARGVHAALIQSYPEIFSNLDLVKVK
jgi:lysophospholipase L1-like esterase